MTLEARHRVFGNMVSILAQDYAVDAHYAGLCSQGVAQFWERDRGVRIERHVLRQCSLPTLRVLAAHEVGHAWSNRQGSALPFESVLAAGLLSLVAFGLPWLVVVGLIGFLAGHLAARYRELAGVAEEIRADWFALQTSCSAEEFVSALREASVVGRRPWSRAVYLRARLARHNERRSGGKLVFFSGSMMWLPGVEKVTAPSTRALWQRVARGVASE